jgi:hypothetical protein
LQSKPTTACPTEPSPSHFSIRTPPSAPPPPPLNLRHPIGLSSRELVHPWRSAFSLAPGPTHPLKGGQQQLSPGFSGTPLISRPLPLSPPAPLEPPFFCAAGGSWTPPSSTRRCASAAGTVATSSSSRASQARPQREERRLAAPTTTRTGPLWPRLWVWETPGGNGGDMCLTPRVQAFRSGSGMQSLKFCRYSNCCIPAPRLREGGTRQGAPKRGECIMPPTPPQQQPQSSCPDRV